MQDRLEVSGSDIVRTETPKAFALSDNGISLGDVPSEDLAFQRRIAFNLWDTNRNVGVVNSVVVLSIVHERLTERRGTIETRHPELREVLHEVHPRDAERFHFCAGDLIFRISSKHSRISLVLRGTIPPSAMR